MVSFRGFLKWWNMRNTQMELQSLAVGLNSSVQIENDLHILMLDYDTKDVNKVKISCREIQGFWNLSDCYLFETKNGYHALFYYDIMPYERCKMIINYGKYVDPMFKYISRYYSHKTLRTAGKHKEADIKFKLVLPGKREPTKREMFLGDLKKREHKLLLLKEHISESEKEMLRRINIIID